MENVLVRDSLSGFVFGRGRLPDKTRADIDTRFNIGSISPTVWNAYDGLALVLAYELILRSRFYYSHYTDEDTKILSG